MSKSTLIDDSLNELRRSLAGEVVSPAGPEYDASRRCFNALVDRRPAVIARCAGARDVAAAFDFARVHKLEVAVRGGGHNPAGHCVCDRGLVIDLSLMRTVEVDRGARIARAGGGATWLDFDVATQAFGLVTPGGVVGSTGVCGRTLGGGIGHLTAQCGLTCDTLVGADVVIPDGTVVRASPDENGDLLWALRGGGGNFGVATRLEFRLHPVDRVVGGVLTYAGSGIREALRRFRDLVVRAPRDLSCQAAFSVDESLTPVLMVVPCHTCSDMHLDDLPSSPGLVGVDIREQTFLDQQRVIDSAYGENRHYWKGHFVRELPDELLDALLSQLAVLGHPPGGILIESLHGAPKDVDAATGALGFRNAAFNVSVMATWQDAGFDEQYIEWARDTAAAIESWSFRRGGYVNYMP